MEGALPEVDVYAAVHKGIRYALLDLLRRMGTVDPNELSEVEKVLDDLEGAFYLGNAHSAHEERFIHRAIDEREPGALAAFDAEHAGLDAQAEELREQMAELQSAPDAVRPGRYRLLYLRYASFVARALEHMTQEELGVQALLDRLFTPAEVHAIYATIVRSIGPEELRVFLRVMVPAATPVERVSLLAPPRASLAREDFEALLQTIRRCLNVTEAADLERRLQQMFGDTPSPARE